MAHTAAVTDAQINAIAERVSHNPQFDWYTVEHNVVYAVGARTSVAADINGNLAKVYAMNTLLLGIGRMQQ